MPAPELAVGDDRQAVRFFDRDELRDRRILDGVEFGRIIGPLREGRRGALEGGRTQEAPDDVDAELIEAGAHVLALRRFPQGSSASYVTPSLSRGSDGGPRSRRPLDKLGVTG